MILIINSFCSLLPFCCAGDLTNTFNYCFYLAAL
jgi:hypothetical protein